MDADFSVELGRDDPVLDFPWTDPDAKVAYVDLKRHPESLALVPEATEFPEFAEFLRTVNSSTSLVESVKCDAWTTEDLSAEEEIFGASVKFASYVDVIFSRPEERVSFPFHETLVKRLVRLLQRTQEIPSAVEVCIRRCCFRGDKEQGDGFYCTIYVTGYGDDVALARQNWAIALRLVANALGQLSASGLS